MDLAGPLGQCFGKLLADLGADVIKVEPAEGDPARCLVPFAGVLPLPEGSLSFLNYNTNKRSIILDLASRDGKRLLRQLAVTSDVLVESFTPGYLDSLGLGYRSLSRINPGLIMTSITPFGLKGPHSHFQGSELVTQAMGGLMYIQGDDNSPPCAAPCDQASQLACMHAGYGTLAALRYRRETGRGQTVDVSLQDVVAHLLFTLTRYANTGTILRRLGTAVDVAPNNFYRCRDGYVCLSIFLDHHWRVLAEWMGEEVTVDSRWADINFRRSNAKVIDDAVAKFIGNFDQKEFLKQAQARHLSVMPLNTLEATVSDPHLRDRRYFQEADHPHIGRHAYPGGPYHFSATPWSVRRPAPLLGQHREEILAGIANDNTVTSVQRSKTDRKQRRSTTDLPLKGIRILDFTRVWAGPFGTRYLGDLGAEVIRVETSRYLDAGRLAVDGGPVFSEINRSKLGITLDFQSPEGQEIVRRLVGVSDVVASNFSAGVLERRGLGYEDLKLVNPDIIVIGMPGYGNTGPYSEHVSYGGQVMALAGFSHLWGYPDSPYETRPKIAYPDFITPAAAAFSIMAALEHRSCTGQGQYIELAQLEAFLSTMGVALLDNLINGRTWQPMGNRDPNAAPHGAYPCRGVDQWCVITCFTQEQWKALCRAMGEPQWATGPEFGSLESRLRHEDELDAHIGGWSSEYTPHQVMRRLQKAGVPAGAVQSGEDLYRDHHLRARDFIVAVEHTDWGMQEHTGIPVRLSGSPGRIERGAPGVGQHNGYVFTELLGISSDEVARLVQEKVIS